MAVKNLPSQVLCVADLACANGTGLRGKFTAMPRTYPALLSLPRYLPDSKGTTEPRPGWDNAEIYGSFQADTRAGRPQDSAGVSRNLARNPRGTIHSRWSRPVGKAATLRPGFSPSITGPFMVPGMADVQG